MVWKVVCAAAVGFAVFLPALQSDELDAAGLKSMVDGLGYETKVLNAELGKEKYEFTIKSDTLNIPVGAEVSPSKRYVWLTVNLGKAPEESSPKNNALLKQNAKIQPTFFYITSKDALMAAYAVENRALTPTILKRAIEKTVDDIEDTKSTWQ